MNMRLCKFFQHWIIQDLDLNHHVSQALESHTHKIFYAHCNAFHVSKTALFFLGGGKINKEF